MRTFTILTALALLFPFLGKGQSVTIDYAFDSSSTYGCDTVGEGIYFYVDGGTSGLTQGDTIDLHADWDDGNGLNLIEKDTVDVNGNWGSIVSHTFSNPGTKKVRFVAIGPNGNSDTIRNTMFISDSCTTIQGKVYVDANGNCIYDNGEGLLNNRSVKVRYNNNLLGYGITDSSGNYQVEVPAGQSPYEVTLIDSGSYDFACPSTGTQTVNNPPDYTTDFAMECPTDRDFKVDHAHLSRLRPGFHSNVYASFEGPSYCTDSLECVKLVLDPKLDPYAKDSLSIPYDSVNGDTLVWDLDTNQLPDLSHIAFPIKTNSSAGIGDTLCVEVILCASSDSDPSNNSTKVCEEVVNSFDPNNKRVLPRGEGAANYIDKNERMRYTINFQNTGTAPAIDVRLDDTLSTDVLDPNSLEVLASSHEIDRVDIREDSIFRFHFKNIMLPDSGTSQADSKGFVRFSVDQKANLSDGTVIENNGAIFFDTNDPVITNEATNTIGEPTSIEEQEDGPMLRVHPNPASERLHVRSSEELSGQVILRDMTGKTVLDERFNGTRRSISVSELPSGVYFLSVRSDDGKQPVREKVMVD